MNGSFKTCLSKHERPRTRGHTQKKEVSAVAKHLVFVGGGHAHLTSLKNLSTFKKPGHQVTLISPSPYHYYSGMGPGMLSGIYQPWEVRFHVKKLVEDQGGLFLKDKVVGIDPGQHLLFLHSGEKVRYDVVSFNTGSEVPLDSLVTAPNGKIFTVKPVINLLKARLEILHALSENKAFNFIVIGGGPAGVEISANLWRLLNENRGKGQITVIGGKRLLGGAPDKVRDLAFESLTRRGLQVVEGCHVKMIENGIVMLTDGRGLPFDMAFVAVGIRPNSLFRDSGLPVGGDGGLLVNPCLQSVVSPDIFGGGDCINLEGSPLAKVGVYAVRENPILYHNLLTALEGGKMLSFEPQKDFLLIFNMGDGRGIFWKKRWVWHGRLAFRLKDYIDRRFMRGFQVSGELRDRSDYIE
jgi:NADH dehydrogenase FAD-containing subunit